jgi:hypothetical protein
MKIDNLEGHEVLYGFAAFWAMILVTAAATYFATKYGAGSQINVQPAPVVNNVPQAAPPNVTVNTPVKVERVETEKAAPPPDVKLYAVMPSVKGETIIREIPVPVVGALREPVKVEVVNPANLPDPDPHSSGKLLPPPKDVKKP